MRSSRARDLFRIRLAATALVSYGVLAVAAAALAPSVDSVRDGALRGTLLHLVLVLVIGAGLSVGNVLAWRAAVALVAVELLLLLPGVERLVGLASPGTLVESESVIAIGLTALGLLVVLACLTRAAPSFGGLPPPVRSRYGEADGRAGDLGGAAPPPTDVHARTDATTEADRSRDHDDVFVETQATPPL